MSSTLPIATAGAPAGKAPIDPTLEVRGLVKRFHGGPPVLRDISLSVRSGECVVVLGANGSGKSTLLRCIVRLIDPDEGQVWLGGADLTSMNGRRLRAARRQAAMVFQQIHLVRRRSAVDNVCFGALGRMPSHRSFARAAFPDEIRLAAMGALFRVGLADKAGQRADTLSGGQAQRVAIARALCQHAAVILADEPVASLDPRAAETVMSLLRDIAHVDRLAVVSVLHQPDLARRYADRLVGMREGVVVFDRAPAEVSDDEIAALYEGEDGD